ncbi:hypothetical protein SHIRM173S_01003 [Streptomyces hirsutus]
MVTGKNARYAAMPVTATHGCRPALPPQITIIGAMATSGTVWKATSQGIRPLLTGAR